MTYQDHFTLPTELLEQVAEQGLDFLPELIRIVINTAMQVERQKHLGVGPYERSSKRQGHANGFKPKTVKTRVAPITFDIPQVREAGFYPQALEKGLRSERALMLALAEMYVQGVSTRKVAAITERLCGSEISSTQVSRAAAMLDEVLEAWRNRPLGTVIYLYLDARYEKVRVAGQIRDAAALIANGVNQVGKRLILGVSVSLGEHELHWRDFLHSLVERGLNGVELIISDAHDGLQAARKAVFAGVPWQRCQFHLQQNASQYVPRQSMKREVAADIRAIFNAPDRDAQDGCEVCPERSQTGRLAGRQHSGRFDCFFFSGKSLAPDPHGQQPGKSMPGNPQTHPGSGYLPQQSFLLEAGQRCADGDQRNLGDRQDLFIV